MSPGSRARPSACSHGESRLPRATSTPNVISQRAISACRSSSNVVVAIANSRRWWLTRRCCPSSPRRGAGDPHPDLLAQDLAGHFLDLAGAKPAELEGAEAQADQPAHRPAEMLQHAADLAVLAFAQRNFEPSVATLDPIERRLDRAVVEAIQRDALLQGGELRLVDLAVDPR